MDRSLNEHPPTISSAAGIKFVQETQKPEPTEVPTFSPVGIVFEAIRAWSAGTLGDDQRELGTEVLPAGEYFFRLGFRITDEADGQVGAHLTLVEFGKKTEDAE